MAHRLTQAEFRDRVFARHGPLYEVVGIYIGQTAKVDVRCNRCGNVWKPVPSDLWRGSGCPSCNTPNPSMADLATHQACIDCKFGVGVLTCSEFQGLGKNAHYRCACGNTYWRTPSNVEKVQIWPCGKCYHASQVKPGDGIRGFRQGVARLTNRSYNLWKEAINPLDLPRSHDAWQIDHIYSCHDAFYNPEGLRHPITVEELCHPANLQMLGRAANIAKRTRSDISAAELRRWIKSFDLETC